MYRIELTPDFERDLKHLDRTVARRIIQKLEWVSQHPETLRFPLKHLPPDLKHLHKYRIGDYRLLLWVDHRQKTITLYGVEHRRSIYGKL